MSLEIEIDKLERRQAGFERERAHLQQQLQRLRNQREEVTHQLENVSRQPPAEQQQEALQAANHRLLKEYIETLDNHLLIAELLDKTSKSLAWWKQQQGILAFRLE